MDQDKGEDAQYRKVVPVTDSEATSMSNRGSVLDLAYLGSLGEDRTYLRVDWPSDQPELTATWCTGAFTVMPGY